MDYFTIYVRANISYYRNSIKLANFKSLVENNFMSYFNTNTIQDTLIHLINDLLENVKYYNMLKNFELLKNIGISKKSLVFFMMNNSIEYIHTKSLFFKLLVLKDNNNLSNETFDKIIETAFKFILTFQSICNRESKNTLSVFVDVQNEFYNIINTYNDKKDLSSEKFENIEYLFYKNIKSERIDNETLRSKIRNNINYTRNKKVTKNILSYLICSDSTSGQVDYTKLSNLLNFSKDIQIDHILPLNPNKNDDNFKYFVQDNLVILKDGQDFITNGDIHQIKDEFYDKYLNVLGNLRLEWSSENIKKSNKLIDLSIFNEKFNTSTQISKRTTMLIKSILDSKLLLSSSNLLEISYEDKPKDSICLQAYKEIEYKNYQPVSFEILGEEYILETYKYKTLLTKIMSILYDLEQDEFKEIAKQKYYPTKSSGIYISNTETDLRRAYSISENTFIETHLSGTSIISFIFKFSKKLGLNNDDLRITLKLKKINI